MKPTFPMVFLAILLVSCASNEKVNDANMYLNPSDAFAHSVVTSSSEKKIEIKIADNCYIFTNTIKILSSKNEKIGIEYYIIDGDAHYFKHDLYGEITISKSLLTITINTELINKKYSELYVYFEGGANNDFLYVPQKIKITL